MLRKLCKILLVLVVVVPLALAGFVWYQLQPRQQDVPLPADLVSLDSVAGRSLLAGADHTADYAALADAWESQSLVSYCGVASGVTAANALGGGVDQSSFFNEQTDAVRSRWQVALGGMSLDNLSGLLSARGYEVAKIHGDDLSIDEFRRQVAANLSTKGDYMLVNYQRAVLGQGRVGHISPLGAYDSVTDQVLIMDTASYKYPFTWVSLPRLYEAMQEADASTGRARGVVEVRGGATAPGL